MKCSFILRDYVVLDADSGIPGTSCFNYISNKWQHSTVTTPHWIMDLGCDQFQTTNPHNQYQFCWHCTISSIDVSVIILSSYFQFFFHIHQSDHHDEGMTEQNTNRWVNCTSTHTHSYHSWTNLPTDVNICIDALGSSNSSEDTTCTFFSWTSQLWVQVHWYSCIQNDLNTSTCWDHFRDDTLNSTQCMGDFLMLDWSQENNGKLYCMRGLQ